MFEHRSEPVVSRTVFLLRLARSVLVAAVVIGLSLGMGAVGYHCAESLPWLDAVLNAAMILTGMGPVNPIKSTAGKLFATGYALYSGLVFVSTSAIVLAPIGHRMLHRLHLEETEAGPPPS